MKIFLDDERKGPPGWLTVRRADEAIYLLNHENVEIISLDHDLGEDQMTGYDVACFIENKVAIDLDYKNPKIEIHSMNPIGCKRIQQVIDSIHKIKGA